MNKLRKKISTFAATLALIAIQARSIFAAGAIGTQEVDAATQNIKRVIISIAMPLRWCINFCKCCSCCNKNDCKFK